MKKAYEINFAKIEEGYLYQQYIVYAKNRNQAKSRLLEMVKYENVYLINEEDEVTYLNIPVIRCPEKDKISFEGVLMTAKRRELIILKRQKELYWESIMKDDSIRFCYIKKRGTYYRPNSGGYTENKSRAGVYMKEKAISEARSCNEITIIPIEDEDHNAMIIATIKDLKSRIISSFN